MAKKVDAAEEQFRDFLATRLVEDDTAGESALNALGDDVKIAWARANGKVRWRWKCSAGLGCCGVVASVLSFWNDFSWCTFLQVHIVQLQDRAPGSSLGIGVLMKSQIALDFQGDAVSISEPAGVLSEVAPHSPLSLAVAGGVHVGDVLVSFNGKPITALSELGAAVRKGGDLTFEIAEISKAPPLAELDTYVEALTERLTQQVRSTVANKARTVYRLQVRCMTAYVQLLFASAVRVT